MEEGGVSIIHYIKKLKHICNWCTKAVKRFLNDLTLIKKKTKFSSYIRTFRWDRLQSHI